MDGVLETLLLVVFRHIVGQVLAKYLFYCVIYGA